MTAEVSGQKSHAADKNNRQTHDNRITGKLFATVRKIGAAGGIAKNAAEAEQIT